MDYEALGKRICTQRKLANLTQDALAKKVGVSCSFIGHIERGTRVLSVETLVQIAAALNVSCDILLQDSLPNPIPAETNAKGYRLFNELVELIRESAPQ